MASSFYAPSDVRMDTQTCQNIYHTLTSKWVTLHNDFMNHKIRTLSGVITLQEIVKAKEELVIRVQVSYGVEGMELMYLKMLGGIWLIRMKVEDLPIENS